MELSRTARQITLLALCNLRELIRDKVNAFFVMIFPFLFIFLFLFLSFMGGKKGLGGVDPLRFSLPGILVMAFSSLGLFGLATPLILHRRNGILRQLGLTPLSPIVYVVAQIGARLLLALVQLIFILVLGYLIVGGITLSQLPGLFLSALLGIVMLFALSYVLGEIIPSPEAAGGLAGGLLAPVLMVTGILIPFSVMPSVVLQVARYIPITYLGDALRVQMLGQASIASVAQDNLVMLGTSVVLIVLATLLFRWQQPESTSRRLRVQASK
jgi:ABC-2 type transport system permease protein